MADIYDVIIVGAGPAGYSAALYTTRDRYRTVVLEKEGLGGGQIMLTERVENYPGIKLVSGPDLIAAMHQQVERFGCEFRTSAQATHMRRLENELVEVSLNGGEEAIQGRSVILCPGSAYRQLGVPGEAQMRQATRVSYCATCDGAFYKGKHVLTVGGGNTALEDTIYLAERFASKVTMIHRREEFRAQKILVEELEEKARRHDIDIKRPYVLEAIVANPAGDEINYVQLRNLKTGKPETLGVDGVFIFAGMVPNTRWLAGSVELTPEGYIRCNCLTLQTSMPGVFVAGDCRQGATMQLVTACADGVTAALMMKRYFRDPKSWGLSQAENLGGSGW